MGIACDASGGLLATAGADRKVLAWDVDGGFCTHYFKGHKGVVTSILFHPEPNKLLLFSSDDDAIIKVWDLSKKKCVAPQSAMTSLAISQDGWTLVSAGRDKVVNLWDLHGYSCKEAMLPTYEALEEVCVISSGSTFAPCLALLTQQLQGKGNGLPQIHFITVGERGIVRIWSSDGALCLFEQKSSDISVSLDKDEVKRVFRSAMMLPSGQRLLCVTADQQFLFYNPVGDPIGSFNLILSKWLIGIMKRLQI